MYNAWRSPALVMAANQETTKEWWDRKEHFDLYVSALVIQEASAGDPNAAKRRLEKLEGIPEVDVTEEVETFASEVSY